ncbi:MAG: alpha/beta fold hydrolase [Chloroflexi bacterium]|nr:alpha/beta fold hydrolase [Chloroflexota bacterium]
MSMVTEQYDTGTLPWLAVKPTSHDPASGYPLLILLHGFGANMYDLADLAPSINATGYVYAFPNGPVAIDVGGGQVGYGWTNPGGFADSTEAQRVEEQLDQCIAEIFAILGGHPGNVALLGFSQGGGVAYRYGLPRPQIFSGVAALSASFPREDAFPDRLPIERNQPIFVAHGTEDPVVPVESGRSSQKKLVGFGYEPSYHEYRMGHEIRQAVIDDLVAWLNTVLPPTDGGVTRS